MMERLERNLNRLGVIIGITMLTVVVMAMSSCGTSSQCGNNRMINEYSNW
tara:strand:- start:501 stop:650 length:150 start_codon:yes stop_codon:yes gene_type:complete